MILPIPPFTVIFVLKEISEYSKQTQELLNHLIQHSICGIVHLEQEKSLPDQILGYENNQQWHQKFKDMKVIWLSDEVINLPSFVSQQSSSFESFEKLTAEPAFNVFVVEPKEVDLQKYFQWTMSRFTTVSNCPYFAFLSPSKLSQQPEEWNLPFKKPLQSYQLKDQQLIQPDPINCFLYAYLHPYSARKDECKEFTMKQVKETGANGQILMWHFLFEIAYKIGKTAKYGA